LGVPLQKDVCRHHLSSKMTAAGSDWLIIIFYNRTTLQNGTRIIRDSPWLPRVQKCFC